MTIFCLFTEQQHKKRDNSSKKNTEPEAVIWKAEMDKNKQDICFRIVMIITILQLSP